MATSKQPPATGTRHSTGPSPTTGTRHTPGRGAATGTRHIPGVGAVIGTWLGVLLALTGTAVAQDHSAPGPEVDAPQPTALVTVDGTPLFRVRGASVYPAEARAKTIAQRIRDFAADSSLPVDSLRVIDDDDHLRLAVGDLVIMRVFAVDADLEGLSPATLARGLHGRIAAAVVDYRQDRRPSVLLRHSAYALLATLVAVLLFATIRRGLRWLESTIERRYKSQLQRLRVQSFQFVHPDQLWAVLLALLRVLRAVLLLIIVLVYLGYVLGLYPWTRPLAVAGATLFVGPLRSMGQAVLAAIPNLIFIAILFVVTRYVLRVTRLFFEGIAKETLQFSGFDPDWALPTYRILRVLLIAFAIVIAYPYIPGSNTAAFKGMSVFLGLIFSLGSSSLIANVIAGYTMTYRRAFKVGDRVRIGDVIGEVTDMRVLVTHLRSVKNESIVIPNSTILQSNVINYSTLARTHGLILHTTVGIGYETPWRQVEAMLLLAAERTPGLLREPPPFVLQKTLGDFCVTYEINAHTDQPQSVLRLYTALHQNILDVFNEYGVQIMTPAYEGDPDQPKVVPPDKWFERPAPSPAPAPAAAAGPPPPSATQPPSS